MRRSFSGEAGERGATGAGPTRDRRSGRFLLFGLFAFAHFVSFFYNSSTAIIASDLSDDLSLSSTELGFTTSLFFAVFAAAQFPIGVTLDRWGPRIVVPGSMMFGVAGSLIFASAHSLVVLAVGRALIGIGMASILMGAFKAFSLWFSSGRLAGVSGLLMGIGAFGILGASTPLAWLSQSLGWRMVFYWGALLIALSAGSIFLGASDAPPGVDKPLTRGNSGGFLAVFSYLHFWRVALMCLFVPGVMFALQSLWAGPYLFDALGLSRFAAGNVLTLMGFGVATGFVASGWLADRFGESSVALADGIMFASCTLVLAIGAPLDLAPIIFFLLGFSGGGAAVVLLAQARLSFPPEMTGRAVSAANSFVFAGAFSMQLLIGAVLDLFPADASGHHPTEAYTVALLLTTAGTVLALVWYTLTDRNGIRLPPR